MRRFPYGESSLVVHLLVRDLGRVSALAKGAYRLRSGYFGVLDLFDTLAVRFRRSEAELATLSGAAVEVRRRSITRDLDRYRSALRVLECLRLGGRAGEGDAPLFDLGTGALDALERGVAPALVCAAFDLSFLRVMGLAPALSRCAACGGAGPRGRTGEEVAFSVRAGGLLCPRCAGDARHAGRRVSLEPAALLRVADGLARAPLAALERFQIEGGMLRGVGALARRFLETHLETRPRVGHPGGGRAAPARARPKR